MTHKHEWWQDYADYWKCKDENCDVFLTPAQGVKRVNATEELPAYAAEQVADAMGLHFDEGTGGYKRLEQLRAYAERMEDD